ncbi:MAG: glycoside hydrolase family 13 protein [Bacteroidales bacterium]|nr:glycoside hydrolase family 13 protein [Bacteroidales bacterium]
MRHLIILFFVFISLSVISQNPINRIDPPFWWAGMHNPHLQVMIHGDSIAQFQVDVNYRGVTLVSTEQTQNANYLFLNLRISDEAKPGTLVINFLKNGKYTFSEDFELFERVRGSSERKSFTTADVIYEIMPDRFANGDDGNDSVEGMPDKANRNEPYSRHGGDIQGIIDHLDYISDMGFTALWLTPVHENNMPQSSYHGYAITDYYKIDPRLGSNELYKLLSQKCKEKGMKLIMDVITNHAGTNYFWKNDLPSNDWFNNYPNYSITNFRGSIYSDPYRASSDLNKLTDGWFDHTMSDMNHKNPFVANYLIQQTIWWIEFAGLDGLRSDTLMYNDRDFISQWAKAVLDEYPNMNIVGEISLSKPAQTAYWQKDSKANSDFNSYLPTVMDFPLFYAVGKAFGKPEGENSGMTGLYDLLNEDFLYTDVNNLMLIVDNHDVSRIFDIVGKDLAYFKMAIAFISTTRGIPQFYYGSELAFSGDKQKGDADLRKDFPGGWKDDTVNGFLGIGLSPLQLEAQKFVRKLLNWRKTSEAVIHGKLIHFAPEDGIYVFFRYSDNERIMVLLNNNIEPRKIDTSRFREMLDGYTTAINVMTDEKVNSLKTLSLQGKSATILMLE